MPKNVGYKKVGRNKRNYRKNRKNVKAKQAYKPQAKRNALKMLAPIIENRKFQIISGTDDESPILLNNKETVLIPDVWEKMGREDEFHTFNSQQTSRGFTGNTLFSKILNHQQILEFDYITNIPYPVELEMIMGWFKTPYITTEESAGMVARNPQGVTFNHDMSQYVARKLHNMLEPKFSSIDPKVVKVKFRKTYNIRGQSVDTEGFGGETFDTEVIRKPLRNTFTWRPNRKYHMKPATIQDGTTAGAYKPDDSANVYWTPSPVKNQDLWIPFIYYNFRNFDKFGKRKGDITAQPPEDEWVNDSTAYPRIMHKQTHYFTDL